MALALLAVGGLAPALLALADLPRDLPTAAATLASPLLWTRLGTSVGLALGSLALAVPLGLGLGWLLARSDVPGRRTAMALVPLPLLLPPLVHVLSWFGSLRVQGTAAVVLVYALSSTPLVVLLAVRALEAVGRARAEQLRVAGGRWRQAIEEIRQALPAALVAAALAAVLVLSDFAVADFLSTVGPKITVYGDSLHAAWSTSSPSDEAAASLPGLALMAGLLAWALRRRRRLGAAVGSRFEPAEPVDLGRWRWPLGLAAWALVAAGAVMPVLSLAVQAGSLEVLVQQAAGAADRIGFTAAAGAAAASLMVLAALPLAGLARQARHPWAVDLAVFLPLAVPALLTAVGLIRLWNRPGWEGFYEGGGLVVLALVGRYLAFAYLPVGGAWERLSPGLDEAARLAGARAPERFLRITLPLLAGSLAVAWAVSFCFALRELDVLQVLSAGQRTLPFWLYSNVVFSRAEEVAALALLLTLLSYLPVLLATLATGRAVRFL